MHCSANRFAASVKDASVTGEIKPPLGALAEFMGACVACHTGYRLQYSITSMKAAISEKISDWLLLAASTYSDEYALPVEMF